MNLEQWFMKLENITVAKDVDSVEGFIGSWEAPNGFIVLTAISRSIGISMELGIF
jgi:hypothetical protein